MIKFETENGRVSIRAELKGIGVYLDNDSLIELAKRDAGRRSKFVGAVTAGGALLFSLANAIEVAGPQGASASSVRAFLDSIGPHWLPVELNPWKVVRREQSGSNDSAPISEEFVKAYFQQRAYELSPPGSKVLDLSENNFFRLSAVLDWVQQNRPKVRSYVSELDQTLAQHLAWLRSEYEKDTKSLDRILPPVSYDMSKPGTFAFLHLQRNFVLEAKAYQFKKHDGLDFCHAVMAAAYGSVSTLDKHWKRRVENLPRPNRLAKIYYRPQIDELVNTLGLLVTARQKRD